MPVQLLHFQFLPMAAQQFQWYKGLLPIPGARFATLNLTNVQDGDMSAYTVILPMWLVVPRAHLQRH